ncbi:MAG: winged helix-turn-helix domain-containing protein [Patescibacteria group bacterium]
MAEMIYAIKVADLSYSGLKISDVKIGKTTNIRATLVQYRRSHRSAEILDLWELNPLMILSDCEEGVHKIAEKYAYEREGEKFIFLQESYKEFSENVSLLLRNIPIDKLEEKGVVTVAGEREEFPKSTRKKIKRTPQKEYRIPILESLIEMGGRGKMEKVLEKIKSKIKDKLTTADLGRLPSGTSIRWENAAQWERQKMKEEGLLMKDSPRGIWEITKKGRTYYQSQK